MEQTQDTTGVTEYIKTQFYSSYLEALKEFVRIPSLAPIFDPEWQTNKSLAKQCAHLVDFVKSQNLKGCKITALQDPNRSPFLIVDVEAFDGTQSQDKGQETVLLYGHMDKQPYGEGWTTDPADPVIKDGILYGRGSSDDGYAFFTSVLAIKACQELNLKHPKCVITIEGSEEGELDDLIYYLNQYKDLLGSPTLVICLDAGAYTKDAIAITSSLRGCFNFDLKAKIAQNSMHSGLSGGVAPNPYHILTTILNRICDPKTQQVAAPFHVEIPPHRLQECKEISDMLPLYSKGLPLLPGVNTLAYNKESPDQEAYQQLLNVFWRPQFAVIGQEGLPKVEIAGNVTHKEITFRCSLRLPPTMKGDEAEKILKKIVFGEEDYTYGAQIELNAGDTGNGFDAPKLPQDIEDKLNKAAQEVYGRKPMFIGGGGSIPFMEVFSGLFPKANFLLTGCCFTESNAHSANENLDLEFCRKLTTVISKLLSEL